MGQVTRIGIDLDNTIINYEQAFLKAAVDWNIIGGDFKGSRLQLRDYLIGNKMEADWQKLQGHIYGPGIHAADLYLGVQQFIKESMDNGADLFIVSHKTEFGHFDKSKTNLRGAALSFLEKKGVFDYIKKENVFFGATRDEKIAKIKTLELDCFIDDLEEVLVDETFPENVKKILFSPPDAPRVSCIESFHCWLDTPRCLSAAVI